MFKTFTTTLLGLLSFVYLYLTNNLPKKCSVCLTLPASKQEKQEILSPNIALAGDLCCEDHAPQGATPLPKYKHILRFHNFLKLIPSPAPVKNDG